MTKRTKKKAKKRGGPPKLTASQVASAVKMVQKGKTVTSVAEKFRVDPSAIGYHCKKAGVTPARSWA